MTALVVAFTHCTYIGVHIVHSYTNPEGKHDRNAITEGYCVIEQSTLNCALLKYLEISVMSEQVKQIM